MANPLQKELKTMRTVSQTDFELPPLFAWADARHRRQEARQLPYAARWLRRHHHGLSPAAARVIAAEAGLLVEADL